MASDRFAARVLEWYAVYGRKDLPWQRDPNPYRIWVSEIMLQQTQVATVLRYFERFVDRFPDVCTLADAVLDEVLHHWSGLGYYARARNLHRAAIIVRDQYGGLFPTEFDAISTLPGVGRSTAGAVLALATGQRHPILDGNVKRVLTRFHGVAGWPGNTAVARELWRLADQHTPRAGVDDYTQAIMDLGATVCTRARPACLICPIVEDCTARMEGRIDELPSPRPRKVLPVRRVRMLVVRNEQGEILLERRPPSGIWGGLWSLPECSEEEPLEEWCRRNLNAETELDEMWPEFRHGFSHYHLHITPILLTLKGPPQGVMEALGRTWYNPRSPDERGLAAPIRSILESLANSS